MTTENKTPDLPEFDPKADRGDTFEPTEADKLVIELSPEEVEVVKGKDEAKAEEEVKAEDKKVAEGEKVEEEKPRDEKGKFIPKARFDEVNNRAKAKVAALEDTIKQLQQRLAPVPGEEAPDVVKLEEALEAKGDEYGKLLADGELDKAKAVLREINHLNRRLGVLEATSLANAHTTESRHVDALGQLVDMYKEAYPVFDESKTDSYSQDMVNYVADLQGRFEATGSSPAEALREAVELCVAKFGLAVEEAAAPEVKPKTLADERKAAGVKKALDVSARQPKGLDKVGTDSDKVGMTKIDVDTLTYEEFNRLPESTLARLRGDFV